MPDSVAFGNVPLVDEEGRPARLADAWKDRPAIVAFLRHYG